MKFLLKDLLIRILPETLVPKKFKKYDFCFLGHPRDEEEIYRKFPFFRQWPKFWFRFVVNNLLWPVTAAKIAGLKTIAGESRVGCVVAVPLTASGLLKNRKRALKKIRRALIHAKKQGASLAGLAGYTASLSRGGMDLMDLGLDITTGHAYTALNVVSNYEMILEKMGLEKDGEYTLAIVGAAGSVGSTIAKYLAKYDNIKLILIDLERKIDKVHALDGELRDLGAHIQTKVTSDIKEVKEAEFVFTATNASEALITNRLAVPGTVYIDDTQPTDIAKEVHFNEDVLVLEAGAVRTPGVRTSFGFGLMHAEDNFCCMAELLVLAAHERKGHYVINRASLDNVLEMKQLGHELGFRVADPQNYYDTVNDEKIKYVANLLKARLSK